MITTISSRLRVEGSIHTTDSNVHFDRHIGLAAWLIKSLYVLRGRRPTSHAALIASLGASALGSDRKLDSIHSPVSSTDSESGDCDTTIQRYCDCYTR